MASTAADVLIESLQDWGRRDYFWSTRRTPSGPTKRASKPKTSRRRSRASELALKREPRKAASSKALSRQARSAARRRTRTERSTSARRAARTKGRRGRSAAARKAARTRAHRG